MSWLFDWLEIWEETYWGYGFWAAVGAFVLTLIWAFVSFVTPYRRKRIFTPNRILIGGTFIASTVLFYPVYLTEYGGVIKSFLLALQHSFRIFAFDGGFVEFFGADATVLGMSVEVHKAYVGLASVFYAFAPLLTFTVLISFFANTWAHLRYTFCFWKLPTIHVFSELNEKTLAMARSIDTKYNKRILFNKQRYKILRKAMVVFTDVVRKEDEAYIELVEEAREMGSILFTKDLESLHLRRRISLKKDINVYLISDDEEEKIRHAQSIINDYRKYENVTLYLFSDNIESKSLIDSYCGEERKEIMLKVVRINDVRSLIYHSLNVNGLKLFEDANRLDDGTREISAAVVGMGKYGTEVVKALLWFCQLPGYRIRLTVFDEKPEARARFEAECPDIKVGVPSDVAGDMRYTLDICSVSFGTGEFFEALERLGDLTYIFVCLGDDRQNIAATEGIKCHMQKEGIAPNIETVVYNSDLKKRLDKKWEGARISAIGDLDSFYSFDTAIGSDIITTGLQVHQRWDNSPESEKTFYMNDYNYCSSIASGLHRMLRSRIIALDNSNGKYTEIFPFYHSEECRGADLGIDVDMSFIREILPHINDNTSIDKLSSKCRAMIDHMYTEMAYIYYRQMSVEERALVLEWLSGMLDTKSIRVDIPMLADKDGLIDGYEELICSADDDRDLIKAMRLMYDAILAVRTRGARSVEEKRAIMQAHELLNMGYGDRERVLAFVQLKSGTSETIDIDWYFDTVRSFAYVEHIRWNAYMRTEGFMPSLRSDRAYKLHFDMVPVSRLTVADCIKDI